MKFSQFLRYTAAAFLVTGSMLVTAAQGAQEPSVRKPPVEVSAFAFVLASDVVWLDNERFVVGRLDGTVSVFRLGSEGVVVEATGVVPSRNGVETVIRTSETTFVTSNDHGSLAFWCLRDGELVVAVYSYAPELALGRAHSGAVVEGRLVAGHANGYISTWNVTEAGLEFERQVSVRSFSPVDRPGDTWPGDDYVVNAVVSVGGDLVVTAAEDGDLVLVRVSTGDEVHRMRYNPSAHFGLNGLAADGDLFVATNCPADASEANLYSYRVVKDRIERLSSVRLFRDTSQPHDNGGDFAAAAAIASSGGKRIVFATTEKGTLWSGTLDDSGAMSLPFTLPLDEGPMGPGGPVAVSPDGRHVAVVTMNVRVLKVATAE
ncbi:MAG: hypothetical protein JNK64_30235 [Myxococcales bacterium]|nr:hypothetical protein [Myxococcales bacterium]